MTETEQPTPWYGLWPLWSMIIVFAAPVVATWWFYFNPGSLPETRSNAGEILNPPLALPANMALMDDAARPFDRGSIDGRWVLVYLSGDCQMTCREKLIELRQIRLALGQSQLYVERLLLLADPPSVTTSEDLGPAFKDTLIAVTDAQGRRTLVQELNDSEGALERIYIIDPLGNLMMRYAPNQLAEDILHDMERLTKASSNWIKGASYDH